MSDVRTITPPPQSGDAAEASRAAAVPRSDASPVYVLAGPTAVGKTSASLALARSLGAEILSADSRQIYRPLTIGTAKPSAEERAAVPHHFVDELDLDEPFSAGRFAAEAWERIASLRTLGRDALVVGGSTLYLYALIHGLADVPNVPAEVRAHVEARRAMEGEQVLYEELRRVDPVTAATLDPTKTQRLVRALEVYHGTGRPLSAYHAEQPVPPYRFRLLILNRPRAELYARVDARVAAMLRDGLIDEVQRVLDAGYAPTLNALQTIGYQEPIAFLRGEIDEAEMRRLIARNTRRYAKRQLTWFRNRMAGEWLTPRELDRLIE